MSDVRTRIAGAAHDLFLEEGIDGVSMRKVAERVGVTAPAIYRYFRDKDELLHEIVVSGMNTLQEYLKPALAGEDPLGRLRQLSEAYLDFALEQPRYFDFAFLFPRRAFRRIPDEIQQHNWTTLGLALEQVAHCVQAGLFRKEDPEQLAILLWSTVHGLVILFRTGRLGNDEAAFRQLYRATVDRQFEALRPAAGGSAGGAG